MLEEGSRSPGTACDRCGRLPEKLSGRLHPWPPLGHKLNKTYRHLRTGGWECQTHQDRAVLVRLDEDSLSDLLSSLSDALTSREIDDTRALFKPHTLVSFLRATYRGPAP